MHRCAIDQSTENKSSQDTYIDFPVSHQGSENIVKKGGRKNLRAKDGEGGRETLSPGYGMEIAFVNLVI